MIELLLRGATVYPGDEEPEIGDVAVNDGKIVAAGPRLEFDAHRVLDLDGLALAPGFIDMHSHSALRPFVDPTLEPKVRQGFTTELINPDGLGPAPLKPGGLEDRRMYLSGLEGPGPAEWPWASIDDYLNALEATRPSTTLCPLVPHGSIRETIMGGARRAPTDEETQEMCREAELGMEAGAWGASFGLIYLPATFSDTKELIAFSRAISRYGGFLVPHVRSESAHLLDAISEMIDVATASSAALNISHLKVFGPRNADKLERLLELIDDAAAGGLDIGFDQYPYGAGATMLVALLPPWMQEGGAVATLERLRDASLRERIATDMADPDSSPENLFAHCGPAGIVITDCGAHGDTETVGRSIADIGAERGLDPAYAAIDLLVETRLEASMVVHHSSEETVRSIAAHPRMLVGSDGIFAARPHPRLWGTAPRVLGRYAIREGLFSTREAVARLSTRAAQRIGLNDRGTIREGLRADLVAFDLDTLLDTSTYDTPVATPTGIPWVIVGGQITVDPDGLTGHRAGGVLRRI